MIERGGGIRPGDKVVICGGGPVGMAACAIMKRQGASCVIISEPEEARAQLGLEMGADYAINPLKESFSEKVLDLTNGMGADLYLEATGLPTIVYPEIEQTIIDSVNAELAERFFREGQMDLDEYTSAVVKKNQSEEEVVEARVKMQLAYQILREIVGREVKAINE